MGKHWNRLKRSLSRRWKEWRLPHGYERLGTRYGGWWLDTRRVGAQPLLIDCGLGEDISFPAAFLRRFAGARVIGVDPNPARSGPMATKRWCFICPGDRTSCAMGPMAYRAASTARTNMSGAASRSKSGPSILTDCWHMPEVPNAMC